MNNREIASVFWIGVALLVALVKVPGFARQLAALFRILVSPRLLLPLVLSGVYIAALIHVAARAGLWSPGLLTDAIAWGLMTGAGLFVASSSVFGERTIAGILLGALGVASFTDVFVNLYVFPLAVELIVGPLLATLVAFSIFMASDDRYAATKKIVDGLLAAFGLLAVGAVTIKLLSSWGSFDNALTWQKFALPWWLTIGVAPLILALGMYGAYDRAFSLVRWATKERRRRWRAGFALVSGLHLHAREVDAINGMWCRELAAARSVTDARSVVRQFRREVHRSARADQPHRPRSRPQSGWASRAGGR